MSGVNPFLQANPTDDGATLVTAPCKSARSALAVVHVSGDEARDFLHGQFSADLRALGAGDTRVTAWLSPKGRVLFMPRVVRGAGQDFLLVLPAAQCAAFCKRLRMFVLRAKVVIEDCSASDGVLVVDAAPDHAPPMPSLADGVVAARDGERLWLLGPRAALATLWDALALPAQNAVGACLADIARGDITLDAALSDEFLPQELDLDVRDGVSFNKGCYPGQEIVARVKFRGAVKRRVQRLALAAGDVPAAGARLLGDDDAHHGTVLMSAAREPGYGELLAVVDVDSGPLHVAAMPTLTTTPLPLPYAVPGA